MPRFDLARRFRLEHTGRNFYLHRRCEIPTQRDFDALENELLYSRPLGAKQRFFETVTRGVKLKYKKTPLEVLMEIATDSNASNGQKIIAASAALPYVHQKMPTMVDLTVESPEHDSTQDARERLRDGLMKLGVDTPEFDPVREVVAQANGILERIMRGEIDGDTHEHEGSDDEQ